MSRSNTMICQHCNSRESDYQFIVNINGHMSEVHLCAQCAQTLARHYMAPSVMRGWHADTGDASPAWTVQQGAERIPEKADERFRRRRMLDQLRARLNRAVETEDYETAAMLRDEITAFTREKL